MKNYDHKQIEPKWRDYWEKEEIYKTQENKENPKFYILDMFPYPSGAGLHVGHPRGYIATDVSARMMMLKGYNVLHPMGWDAFGLPTESYAIKNKVHPRTATEQNIATFKKQLQKMGCTYDWTREINTTDPEFYKWTQWIFLQLYKKGLAYQSYKPINWCPSCQTGLANEDLEGGKCERCDTEVEQKPMRQWVLKITDYADVLLDDLDKLDQWSSSIVEMQKNWIGRSCGAKVKFEIKNWKSGEKSEYLEVFTTRPDTLFGCTYMAVAPEHQLIENWKFEIENWEEVSQYLEKSKKKTELERTAEDKEKTGVKLEGVVAVNPANGKEILVFVADYVLVDYGTGAIMAVPAHDERDYEFAQKYDLDILKVVQPSKNYKGQITNPPSREEREEKFYTGEGTNVNSDFLNGLETKEAKKKMIKWLEENGYGFTATDYKLKDWVFSRQRYWGEPIPMVHCQKCGTVPAPEDELPVELPEVTHYKPSGTGKSPLANIGEWVNTICPKCGAKAKRETDTMPQWAGSSWYYLRFIDPDNKERLVAKDKDKYWSPVNLYVGGAEHACRHLIYARFWHKFLYDIGVVNYEEPFKRLEHVGIILAEDGRKMSKRYGNVINPDNIIEEYGADAMRVYEMFMGPFNQSVVWSVNGLVGVRRFLERVYSYVNRIIDKESNPLAKERIDKWMKNQQETPKDLASLLHKTIKRVEDDIYKFKFNTAISQLMIFRNALDRKNREEKILSKADVEKFLIILSPFAPHLTEELWERLGHSKSIFYESWPEYKEQLIKEEKREVAIQVNGKLRDTMEVKGNISKQEAVEEAEKRKNIKKWMKNKELIKVVYVEDKLVNFVVK